MEKASRVTKKLIAERTGLSIATIDRALNERGNVKPETRRRVLEAVQELNYVVNKSARFLSKKVEISIAVVLLEYPRSFWEQVERGVWDAFNELRDYGLNIEVIHVDDTDEYGVARVRELIQSGKFNALALPAYHDEFIDLIDQSIDTGMAVSTINIDSPSSKRLFYVGSSYTSAGKLAAELLCKLIGGTGNVVLVTDSWTSFQAHEKITGFREGLASFPKVKLIGPVKVEREDFTASRGSLEQALKDADGIYVSSVLESFADVKAEVNQSAVLIGHDMSDRIYQHLLHNTVTATICQDPVAQGYLTVKKLFNHLALKEEIETRENITKLEIAFKENARFYI